MSRDTIPSRVVRKGAAAKTRSVESPSLKTNGVESPPDEARGVDTAKVAEASRAVPSGKRPCRPKVVTVSMTPQEQEVYAFMGVSPIVLYKGELRNPSSAVVKVALPGKADAVDATSMRSRVEAGVDATETRIHRH